MARLATTLAATAFTPLGWLKPGPSLEGGHRCAEALRLGGVAGTAADPLAQAGQFGRQGGELDAQLLDLLPLSQNQRTDGN